MWEVYPVFQYNILFKNKHFNVRMYLGYVVMNLNILD